MSRLGKSGLHGPPECPAFHFFFYPADLICICFGHAAFSFSAYSAFPSPCSLSTKEQVWWWCTCIST
ncbi:hypothetical protein P175DRAFT_0498716 [Aspergillus ochraceoroseus IBT 24754]|uniref:Uncharacterized protein n=1 Tax=Aspergillus ochraceoroseus IBT 24754 TaxID=1392256 RepID=A0A2T5MAQ1_9EURO|nr:uncharacterized protein P175DRAFT_0498716 [Aspergillus ochraceoroseus IBT 24754]PTU25616.1 hypothetical protein P175DRAFT_0498716 [Aspergillus ochraceoroseus IBT 24754]